MRLYIVRHGIAIDRDDPKCPADPDRYLTDEGVQKTRKAAEGLAALGADSDLLLSSPYVRAWQTAEIFAAALGYSNGKIRKTDHLLPGAQPAALFRELAKEKNARSVFLFGHAPNVDDVLAAALGVNHHITSMKKAGVALLELKQVSPATGELLWLAPPKLLKRAAR
ncbi:MAG TPA: phosphohistidine phosphatase SixA [Candidatus Acidoferrum sp.]|jgi:phosphohistidine phosphatase|nr:phosphohistidine phosphatase SixA [Candidatus Acidoferrum sp.]